MQIQRDGVEYIASINEELQSSLKEKEEQPIQQY